MNPDIYVNKAWAADLIVENNKKSAIEKIQGGDL